MRSVVLAKETGLQSRIYAEELIQNMFLLLEISTFFVFEKENKYYSMKCPLYVSNMKWENAFFYMHKSTCYNIVGLWSTCYNIVGF